MERGGFRGGRGLPRGGPGRGRGGFNGGRGRGGLGVRGGIGRGAAGALRGGGIPRGRGGVFNPTHLLESDYSSNVLVVSSRGRGGVTDGGRGGGRRGAGGRGAFRGGVAGVPGSENKFRGRGGRGDRGGMMGRGMGRGAGADRGALKRVQPTGGVPSKRGRYDASQPNGYNQYQSYEQPPPEGYGPPQTAAQVSYGGQGYNNGSYGGGYGASQAQAYGSQGYGYGQASSYDNVGADYSAGYASAQDSRYSAQQADPYGDYSKPARHYEAESYSAGYGQGGAAASYPTGYDDRSGYAAQSYDASGYGTQAVQGAQQYEALQLVYGDSTLSRVTIFNWIRCLRNGREKSEDDPRNGRPFTALNKGNVYAMKTNDDCRVITTTAGISIGCAHSILKDRLNFSELSACAMAA